MKKIEKLPFEVKCITKEGKKLSLNIVKAGDRIQFTFDVFTERLYRMGNERDNKVELFLNGKWEVFTTALKSTMQADDLKLIILANNNKGSHYQLVIVIDEPISGEIGARAEEVELL